MTTLDPGQGLDERFATLPDGRRIRHVTAGESGPLVVFEAGMGSSSSDWVTVQRELSTRARTVSYDRSGSGGSDPDTPGTVRDLERLAADLLEFLDVLAPDEPVVLVAHSWGGPIIRVLAERAPDRVAGLVFVDSSLHAPLSSVPPWVAVRTFGLLSLLVRLGAKSFVKNKLVQSHPWDEMPAADRDLPMRVLYDAAGCRYAQREARALKASFPLMAELEQKPLPPVPAVYLVGARVDKGAKKLRPLTIAEATRIAGLSPAARVELVEGAGHQIAQEKPYETVRQVGLLLDEVARTPRTTS